MRCYSSRGVFLDEVLNMQPLSRTNKKIHDMNLLVPKSARGDDDGNDESFFSLFVLLLHLLAISRF